MRITQGMMVRQSLSQLQLKNENMSRLQQAISTGKEIENPSDDPERFYRAQLMREDLERNQQKLDTIGRSTEWLDVTAVALENLNNLLMEAREVAQRGADSTNDDSVLDSMAVRIGSIIDEALNEMNTNYLGRSIFSGSQSDVSEPFIITGDVVSYAGDDQAQTRSLGPRLTITQNIDGASLGATSLLENLITLRQGLETHDRAVIGASIDNLSASANGVLALAASTGATRNTLTIAEDRLLNINISLQSFISDEEDTDFAEAIVKFESEQTAYTAALRTTSEIVQLNIMQYFR